MRQTTGATDIGRHGRNISWLLVVDVFWKILSVFYFAYVFEKLSKSQNELYALFISVLPMLMVVNAFGFQDVINREVSRRRDAVHRLMGSALLVQFGLFLAGAACAWAAAFSLHLSADLRRLVVLWPVAGFLAASVEMHTALFAAHERFRDISLITVTTRAITVAGAVALLYAGWRVNALVAYVTAVAAVQWAISYAVFRAKCGGYRFEPNVPAVKYLFREGFSMAAGRIAATSYYRIDLPLIRLAGSQAMAVNYAVGPRFFVLLTTIPNTFESIFFPILSRKSAPGGDAHRFAVERFLKLTWMVALPMAVGMTLLGRDIVRTLAGEQYLDGVPVVVMFTWVVALAMFDRVAVVYLRASGRQAAAMWLYLAALAAKTALAVPAVYFRGIAGMIAVNVACSGAVTLFVFGAMRVLIPGVRPLAALALGLRPGAACAVMAGVLWFVRGQSMFWTVPLGAAVYGATLLATGAFDDFDRRFLADTLRIGRPRPESEVKA